MLNPTTIIMKKILETYKGFEGLNEVVDVGGGVGATLHTIISKYPHIKGVNYDLPQPHLKWILHDWSDERCLKLLNNCYKALPDSGKVIIVDLILPLFPETNLTAKYIFQHDMLMLAYTHGGNVRTEKQLEELTKGAGFASLNVVCCAYGFSVMECYKKM
ncbi:caffeate O-methyltransferase [Cinnamomum micranthum f. kanehirae]|uniref:Caffeate O-methyltransferase n=1 Tax=Cinnamomum micranthum f. kanehirae TaxID=337451 RepID=A0A3S4P742_9MAGN|nr:caffeate O-methyltransferase [Cinnamomum micranthum f. kanehirae]